jgi:hypothetical protein
MAHLPLWTPVASFFLALAWVLPNGSPPWYAFHKDAWLALVLWTVAMVWVFKHRGLIRTCCVDPLSAVFVLLALLTVTQWGIGILFFSGHAAVGVGYFMAAAVGVVIGRAWEQNEPGGVGDFLFLAFLLAALGTSGLMLVQWLRLDFNEAWVNYLPPWGRPYGNLLQPNNAATLLLLGMVSLLWYGVSGRISKFAGMAAAIYFLFFVALSGSRIGYLSFSSLAIIAIVLGFRHVAIRPLRPVFGMLLILLPLFIFLISHEWAMIEVTTGSKPLQRDLANARMLLYPAYLEAALAKPWLGYGFEQGTKTQLAATALGHELPGLFTWAHNAFLDVATWFGIPMALLAIAAVALSMYVVVRARFNMKRSIYVAAVYVVFLHGMVELPLAFAYFLLPVSMLAGAMMAGLGEPAFPLPRFLVGSLLVGLGMLLGTLTYDYLRIESAFYTYRFKQANIGRNHPLDVPDTFLLNQFEALLVGLRGSPESLSEDAMRRFEQAIILDPSAAGLQHLAELQLRRGDVISAQKTADMGRLLSQGKVRHALAARWRYLGNTDPIYRTVEWRD